GTRGACARRVDLPSLAHSQPSLGSFTLPIAAGPTVPCVDRRLGPESAPVLAGCSGLTAGAQRPALSGPGPARDDSKRRTAAPEQRAAGAGEARTARPQDPRRSADGTSAR